MASIGLLFCPFSALYFSFYVNYFLRTVSALWIVLLIVLRRCSINLSWLILLCKDNTFGEGDASPFYGAPFYLPILYLKIINILYYNYNYEINQVI